eukprot:UN11808
MTFIMKNFHNIPSSIRVQSSSFRVRSRTICLLFYFN